MHFKKYSKEKNYFHTVNDTNSSEELSKILYDWSIGKNADTFYKFYAYLNENSCKNESMPFLDKDLLFSIDAIRLKEINGEKILKQKAQVVVEIYLDSIIPPKLQIDIDQDMLYKLLKAANNITATQNVYAKSNLAIFNEAMTVLFKKLLPYWGKLSIIYNRIMK
jgi:hypothetical protein